MSIALRYLPHIAWGLLAFAVLFWRLGEASFWDPDEAHYAQTSHELLARSDWLTPYYNDEPFFDKPILFHAIQAIPMRLAGSTEASARIVPASAALAIVGWTWWLGRTMVSAQVGFAAALLLTANVALFALARYAILDTLFTAFLFGGVALVTVAAFRDRPRLQYAGYVLLALATLTKGPIAIVLCGLSFVLALLVSQDARARLLQLRWITGLAIVVGLSAPWFLLMTERHGPAFINGYFLNENLLLFSRSRYGQQPPWWFYLQILATGFLPWTSLAAGRLYDDLRAVWQRRHLDGFERLLWVWVLAIVGFFSLSSFKLDHYVFPAAPALCLLSARAWADLKKGGRDENAGAYLGLRIVGPVLMTAGLVVLALLVYLLELPGSALLIPASLLAGGAATTVLFERRRLALIPWLGTAAMALSFCGVQLSVLPVFEEKKVIPEVAAWVAAHSRGDARIATYRLDRWNPAYRFYVRRHVRMLQTPAQAQAFLQEPGPVSVVMLEPAFQELVANGFALRVVHARDGMWVTTGRALWRERSAPTRFVVVARASD